MTVARVTVGIAVAIAALRLIAPPPLELLDLKALDFRHAVRGPVAAGGEVVIVAVDEASLAALGRWPWPRAELAALVDRLSAAGAAVIGFDMVFDQADTGLDVAALKAAVAAQPTRPAAEMLATLGSEIDNDVRLARALGDSGRVVLGYFFEFAGDPLPSLAADAARVPELSVRAAAGAAPAAARGLVAATRMHLSVPALTAVAAGGGHFNFLADPDGLYRRLPIAIRAGDRLAPALSVEVMRRYLGGAPATLALARDGVTAVRVGDRSLPVDEAGQLWINYLGPPRTVRHVSAADVVAGRVGPEALAGKIAIVGFTAAGFDEVATPFAPVVPGVEVQATVIDNVLHGASLRRPWELVPAEAAAVIVFGLVLGLALQRLRAVGGALTAVVLALAWAWGTQRLFTTSGLVVSAVYPLGGILFCTLGGAVYQSRAEERAKRRIRDAFRLYLNPEVTEIVAREPERLRLGGERRDVTVLFSDVRNFTSISEGLPADALGELLNEYLGAMTDVVFRRQGLLDKYIGDAVMAFWGAPVPAPDHATRCCEAALDMLAALATLHAGWRARGLPLLEIGIGINTGEAAVGNFGSAQRFSYTAVGDSVNLASRLEGLNKDYGTTILVSESTRTTIGDAFVCREIDAVKVKGRAQAVAVYELLGRRTEDADGRLARRASAFGAALGAYRRQAWDEALARLRTLATEWPDDRVIAPFEARCRALRAAPPGEGWDGVRATLAK